METPWPRPRACGVGMALLHLLSQQADCREGRSLGAGCFLAAGQAESAGKPSVHGLSWLVNSEKPKYFRRQMVEHITLF